LWVDELTITDTMVALGREREKVVWRRLVAE
jgi:hypothetical protein